MKKCRFEPQVAVLEGAGPLLAAEAVSFGTHHSAHWKKPHGLLSLAVSHA